MSNRKLLKQNGWTRSACGERECGGREIRKRGQWRGGWVYTGSEGGYFLCACGLGAGDRLLLVYLSVHTRMGTRAHLQYRLLVEDGV